MTSESIFPLTVYGSSISYFTGKLENYFKIKGIPYEFKGSTAHRFAPLLKSKTGSTQVPGLELGDGRWMTDSTPIIQWFEDEMPTPTVMPADPLQRFFSLLIEDYADEWLWRPAMHYRWYYPHGARFASSHLAGEMLPNMRLPAFYKRRMITQRQRKGYTTGDGIVPDQVPGVEAIYRRTLEHLEAIFKKRAFLLGDKPSLVDIGFSGPFFRHFALDPIPEQILRNEAPAVFEWVARLWNTKLEDCDGHLHEGIPDDWAPILDDIGTQYLPYLCANVDAVVAKQKRFDVEIGGVRYLGARWLPYRVWCLQQLREHFNKLSQADQTTAKSLLEKH